jgi:hypothetical protein
LSKKRPKPTLDVTPEMFSQAISAGNHNLLREYALQIRKHISTRKRLPEDYFNFLFALSNDQKFLELGGAGEFLIIFDDERLLTNNQRKRLLPVKRLFYEDFYGDMNPEIIKEALNDAIRSADIIKFEDYCLTIDVEFFGFGFFPEHWLNFILELLDKKESLNLEKGLWRLFWIFEFNWDDLSNDQKKRVLPVLERNYRLFKDCESHDRISSLLGKFFCNEDAFETLCRLTKIPEEVPRSSVPHGFEQIISDSKDPYLAKMAWIKLQRMKNDSSKLVRDKVESSIQQLKYKNIKLVNNKS